MEPKAEPQFPGPTSRYNTDLRPPSRVSIGIFAWNEEKVIGATLESLFGQTIFQEFSNRGWHCEIVCVVNGCTDTTPEIAAQVFTAQKMSHPFRDSFDCRIAGIKQAGKLNAWNHYVHTLSASDASTLVMMDADISLHRPDTLWRMIAALANDSRAAVSADQPRKHTAFKKHRSPADWVSLAMSNLTNAASGQLCGQLYCIRSEIARNIYLPKDLGACEDGFIKALACTDFLSRPILPERIHRTEGAEHTFEAYTTPVAIFRNQKRQMIGQTVVHILVDQYLNKLSPFDQLSLAAFLRKQDEDDPLWLKRLVVAHLKRTRFWWRLYPGLMTYRFRNLRKLGFPKRIVLFPAALGSAGLAIFTSFAAWRSLKGGTTSYWPKAPRRGPEHGSPSRSRYHTSEEPETNDATVSRRSSWDGRAPGTNTAQMSSPAFSQGRTSFSKA